MCWAVFLTACPQVSHVPVSPALQRRRETGRLQPAALGARIGGKRTNVESNSHPNCWKFGKGGMRNQNERKTAMNTNTPYFVGAMLQVLGVRIVPCR